MCSVESRRGRVVTALGLLHCARLRPCWRSEGSPIYATTRPPIESKAAAICSLHILKTGSN